MKFKVGDLVVCYEQNLDIANGALGVVTSVQARNTMPEWPITVHFANLGPGGRFEWCYTEDGFRVSSDIPFNRIEPATKLHKLLAGLE